MTRAAGVPWWALAALTGAVALAHWLALQGTPRIVGPARAPAAGALVARTVDAGPLPPPPAAAVAPDKAAAAGRNDGPLAATASATTAPTTSAPSTTPATPARPATRRLPADAGTATPVELPAPATDVPPPDAAAPSAPAAVVLPPPATWRYTVTGRHRGQDVAGQASLAWQHDGVRYAAAFELAAPPVPARFQRSSGTLDAQGLAPARFADRVRSEEAVHFDRGLGRLVFSTHRAPVPLQDGAQDRLSVLVQLAALVAGSPGRWRAGDTVTLQVAGTREADTWTFGVRGRETLVLPGGTVEALLLVRPPVHAWDWRLEAWIGPGGAYGVARLRLTAPHGDWLDVQWSGTDKG